MLSDITDQMRRSRASVSARGRRASSLARFIPAMVRPDPDAIASISAAVPNG